MRVLHFLLLPFLTLSSGLLMAQQPANWQSLGPVQFPVNVSGQINGIGRVCQMKFHPSDPQKVYAVSASGGLWFSANGTTSWQKCGTDALPLTACASVCIDYTNDSILYLGTGDPNYYGTGLGVYKSTDAGSSWLPAQSGMGNRMAIELLMHPTDHLTLVAATNDGIWKSTNGGQTWNVKKPGGEFTDMVARPAQGSLVLYAVTMFGEFFRSFDFGDSWTLINNGIAVPGGGSAGGTRLAVSAADSTTVYVGMLRDEGTIFRSTDGGSSFTTVYHNPAQSLTGYDVTGNGQGNYNFCMTASQGNPNVVFVGSHVVWRSTDGGITWTQLTQWYAGLHTDMHQMLYNPYNPTELYNINDGGVWRSLNAGANWSARSNGLAATEVYKAAVNPLNKSMISIGTQDNGELYSLNGQWRTNRGGDWGSRMTYDYLNSNLVYYHENGKRRNVVAGPEVSIGLPFTASNNCRLAFTPLNSENGLAGQTDLYFSADLSSPVPFWAQTSTFNTTIRDICFSAHRSDAAYVLFMPNVIRRVTQLGSNPVWTSSTVPTAMTGGGSICTVAADSNVVYITAGSKVYRSGNQGQTWTNISLNLPNINILRIYNDPYDTNEGVYVCNAAGVWYYNQNLSAWYSYNQGLPFIANITDFMFYDDGPLSSVIRLSTYGRGVWETTLQSAFTSLPEPERNSMLKIAPNPVHDGLLRYSIPSGFAGSSLRVRIFSLDGKMMLEQIVDPAVNEIDIKSLSDGAYLIELQSANKQYATGRFIVQ